MTRNDNEIAILLGVAWAAMIAFCVGMFLAAYPLHIIQNASGFGFVLDGLGGYYWESAE